MKDAWMNGPANRLGPKGEALAWALRQAWYATGNDKYGMVAFVQKHTAINGEPFRKNTFIDLFKKIDRDPEEWYPGMHDGSAPGRKTAMNNTNQAVVARSAMATKKRGHEPTYKRIIADNPNATRNPETGEPVSKRAVYNVLRSKCYDDENKPEDLWEHQARCSKAALPDPVMEARWAWAVWMLDVVRHLAEWYYKNLVWTDICNKILPTTEKIATNQALARKGPKGWMSKGSKMYNRNLRGKKECLKQNSWGTVRVWFAPVLSRGKLHVVLLGDDFPGENPRGAAQLVAKVRAALNVRFRGDDQPNVVMTDKGRGFYRMANSKITPEYAAALEENNLSAFMGADATRQPGDLKDLMLHETAVAWLDDRLTVTTPSAAWGESVDAFGSRLKQACEYINANHEVENLCRELPQRLLTLRQKEGARLKK